VASERCGTKSGVKGNVAEGSGRPVTSRQRHFVLWRQRRRRRRRLPST